MKKFNVLCLWLVFLMNVAITSAFAMETETKKEDSWRITGDFSVREEWNSESDGLDRQMIFKPLSKLSYIKQIILRGYRNNNVEIWIKVGSYRYDIFKDIQMFAKWRDSLKRFVSTDKYRLDKFLDAFYKRDFIPDLIIDRIIKDIGIEDFRMDANRMIENINKQMGENSTADDFKRIAFEELAKIKDLLRRQTIIWGIIQDLRDSDNFDKDIIVELCENILDKNLPFFADAKSLQANLMRSENIGGKVDIMTRYQKPITLLLSASGHKPAQEELNVLVKAFYHDDVPSNDFPDELKDINCSPESVFKLINFIRQQKLELDQLRKQPDSDGQMTK
jgi:hypothetical protein